MGYYDWTKEEKTEIMQGLKALQPSERVIVRDEIKSMSASDALERLALARDNSVKPSESPNKPVKPSKGTKARAGVKQAVEKPISQDQGKLERVQGDISSPYYFNLDEIKDRIRQSINEYLMIHDMEQSDMIKAPQRIFGALSDYIGEKVFKGTKTLRRTPYDTKAINPTNNNAYDVDKIADVLGFYFTLCKEYNKTFLLDYAAGFLAVDNQTFYNLAEKLTPLGFDVFQKREESLAAGIVDGKQSPVGALAALNHWHGWSGASTGHTTTKETTVIYPVLVDINKNNSSSLPDNSNNNQ